MRKLRALLELLRLGAPLPLDCRDAAVRGTKARVCRVEPGWLLTYQTREGTVTLLRMRLIPRKRPKAAPPMGLWFRTLLRSPVKTALTVLLLAAAAFLLLDNLSSYAMQTEAVRQTEEKVEGVLTVERSPVSEPRDGTSSWFLLTGMGESYRRYTYDSVHHEALRAADLAALEILPNIDAVDRRYMTAGISEDYGRIDGPYANYGYMDRLVIEATVTGKGLNDYYARSVMSAYASDGVFNLMLGDVTLLAGRQDAFDEHLHNLGGRARLIVYTIPDGRLGTEDYYKLGGGSGDSVDSMAYDVTRSLCDSVEKGRRYVFVVRAQRYASPKESNYGFWLGDDSLEGWWPYITDVTDLPEDYLEGEDFAPLRELIQVTNDDLRTFDVVYTDDMASIRRVTRQQLTAAQGRLLGPEDAGKAVCAVSERFLTDNGLSLGDTVTLKLGNVLMEQYEPLGAVAVTRSRYSDEWEERTFTIIGAWKDAGGRRWQEHE